MLTLLKWRMFRNFCLIAALVALFGSGWRAVTLTQGGSANPFIVITDVGVAIAGVYLLASAAAAHRHATASDRDPASLNELSRRLWKRPDVNA